MYSVGCAALVLGEHRGLRKLCGARKATPEKQWVSGAAHAVTHLSVRRRSAAGGAAGAAVGNKAGAAGGAVLDGAAGQKRGAASVPLAPESRGKTPRVGAPAASRVARAGAPPFRPPQLQGRCDCWPSCWDRVREGLQGVCVQVMVGALQYAPGTKLAPLWHWQRKELPCRSKSGSHVACVGPSVQHVAVHAAAVETVVEC